MPSIEFDFISPPQHVSNEDWSNWQWHMRKSLKSQEDFENYFSLTQNEVLAFKKATSVFRIKTTPFYAKLAGSHTKDPIRKIMMPHLFELSEGTQQMLDPLAEQVNRKTSRIIHRYPDRALLLVTDTCSVYCRYCTRKHFTASNQNMLNESDLDNALAYIQSKNQIKEVILSGGDPLTLSTEILDRILFRIRQIDHIEIIRIGTRMPVVCPMRVDLELVTLLKKYKPVFLMTHFNHPREISAQAATALELFVDHGVPVFNQAVLLNGVNNHEGVIRALSRRLLFLRVKPYYLFLCDPSLGTDHLRIGIQEAKHLQRQLWGSLSGLAFPHFALDIPGGGGKVQIAPDFVTQSTESWTQFKGWDGIEGKYFEPIRDHHELPFDWERYSS